MLHQNFLHKSNFTTDKLPFFAATFLGPSSFAGVKIACYYLN